MPSAYRWVCEKPSKSLILAVMLFIILIRVNTCSATVPQNKTLTEVSSYNFTEGFYNVVKYSENSETNFWVMYESDIPYLNITYKALSDGYLDIYLNPIDGPFPYIELEDDWERNSLTYSKTMRNNETTYFLISPPMIFSDYNSSRVVGGGTTLWEMYTWPRLTGLINYTFVSFADITLEINWYPNTPRQGDAISLFPDTNIDLHNYTWTITGNGVNSVNNTEILEITSLPAGKYSVSVRGYDDFNHSHLAEKIIEIKTPLVQSSYFDIRLFSLNYPESVNIGDIITLTASIDYSLPRSTDVKYILVNPDTHENYSVSLDTLNGDGSTMFSSQLEAEQTGVMKFIQKLYYNKDGVWVELDEAQRSFSVSVNKVDESNKIPGFNIVSISAGLILTLYLTHFKGKDK